MALVLLDANNFILGIIPDSLGLLLFGVVMILAAALMRRVLTRNDERQEIEKFERTENQTIKDQNIAQKMRGQSKQAICR